ncbi:alkene reductase [Pseudooceanicola sp. CBS1P-1]|uniref:Alkene reductase n=1 Tax=Pseudooceanicola albus TaxID=2692189 RepID=A0A6L7G972_9RHOB|nr:MULTISPECIES: alkene reductase [Pseudooceanicola]MBT9384316.1 alkene reductase [Pseudooceanicola endophyticus]MXN19946.1 alkene reductase [Pseudooceanicola albus]
MSTYFDTLKIGDLELPNRIVMPALTRARASREGVPQPIMREYYRARASAGLIISEGTYVNAETCAFEYAPGIYTDAQVEAWKPITEAVHDEGGRIFCQLWHCGRAGAAALLGGQAPLSPSGVNDDPGMVDVYAGLANGSYAKIMATPSRAMTLDDIHRTIADFGRAAARAKAAGFDGVEIHAANGYLPHQFLSGVLNTREDAYGGSLENRARFLTESFAAIAESFAPGRIGIRVSPYAAYNNTREADPHATYSDLAQRMQGLGAGYMHFADMNGWFGNPARDRILAALRPHFAGPIIGNGGLTPEQGSDLLATGQVQAVAFGRGFLANPDLVTRIAKRAPLADPRPEGWYAAGALGYTDYPALAETQPA